MDQNRAISRFRIARLLGMPATLGAALLLALVVLLAGAGDGHTAARLRTASTFSTPITGTQWTPPAQAFRIYVEQDGMYRLTHADLQAHGFPVDSVDPAVLRLYYMGQEIPLQWQGDADNQFESGEAVAFYGRGVDSLYREGILPEKKYTRQNVYWLAYAGSGAGARMAEVADVGGTDPVTTYLHTIHLEQNVNYESARPYHPLVPMPDRFEPGADRWLWFDVSSAEPSGFTNYFDLVNLPSSAPAGELIAQFQGVNYRERQADPPLEHHLKISVKPYQKNAVLIYDDPAAGQDAETFTVTAPLSHAVWLDGTPYAQYGFYRYQFKVELATSGASDRVYLNWIRFRFWDTLSVHQEHDGLINQPGSTLKERLAFGGKSESGSWLYTVSGFTGGDLRVYDVTDPFQPHQIVDPTISGSSVSFGDAGGDRQYVALSDDGWLAPVRVEAATPRTSVYSPADLFDTGNAADWIAISHADFWDQALQLAEYRHQQTKYRVALIDVQQIYDQFNGGLQSPEAIRDFLHYVYHNWQSPRPRYVLLVGDGHVDMRNDTTAEPIFVPPYLDVVEPTLGETAADNRFVTLVGDDVLPDMSIGRFPVSTAQEAQIMVSKTISYETTPTINDWNTNVLFIADNLEGGGGNFYEFSDILADGYADPNQSPDSKFLPEDYNAVKAYLDNTCNGVSACRAEIIDAINNGALFTSYVGHATETNWAAEGLMNNGDVVQHLNNSDRLSIFLAMACYEGFFHRPGRTPLAESYLLHADGGAVASWSPTGFGVATGHDYLEQGLFLAVFQDDVTTLGDATDAGRQYLYDHSNGRYLDLIDTFLLFGDPALRIQTFVVPTAVDVADLTAQSVGDQIVVEWATANELAIVGFNVLRGESEDGPFVQVNDDPIWAASPGTAEGHTYRFTDAVDGTGAYWYQLQVLRSGGTKEPYGLVAAQPEGGTLASLYLPALFSSPSE